MKELNRINILTSLTITTQRNSGTNFELNKSKTQITHKKVGLPEIGIVQHAATQVAIKQELIIEPEEVDTPVLTPMQR